MELKTHLLFSRHIIQAVTYFNRFDLPDPSKVLNLLLAPPCGTTPLHDAVGNGHQQVVELLVRAGGEGFYGLSLTLVMLPLLKDCCPLKDDK